MSDWLEGFIYRINLTPLPFVIAGVAALLISVLSVGGYAWTVARAKPVNALRYE